MRWVARATAPPSRAFDIKQVCEPSFKLKDLKCAPTLVEVPTVTDGSFRPGARPAAAAAGVNVFNRRTARREYSSRSYRPQPADECGKRLRNV